MQPDTISHYRLLEKIGSGGMGEVYKAQDLRLRRVVALKLLPPAWAADEERKSLLLREARLAAQLDHPHICGIFEVDEAEDGRVFLAIPYYAGESLTRRLVRGEMPVEPWLVLGIQIGEALAAAHRHGIIHRDVKPSNILLTAGGDAKLLDFGLAVSGAVDPGTARNLGPGTLRYMSPEQVRGSAVDHRTDLWSLGATLYEALAGYPCFSGADSAATVEQIVGRQPPPLRDANPHLSPALVAVVERCLSKDPDARYQDAGGLVQELRGLREALTADTVMEGGVHPTATDGGDAPAAAGDADTDPPTGGTTSGPAPRLLRGRWLRGGVATVAALLLAAALAHFQPWSLVADTDSGPSLMILPLANLTGDPELDYVGDGISSGLVGRLGQVHGLRLVGSAVSAGYRDLERAEAGRLAGAERLLDGSVLESGGVLRVETRLTDTRDGTILWADTFEGTPEGIFGLQQRIAAALADAMELPLSRADRARLGRQPTGSQHAYRLYLKARRALDASPDIAAAAVAERELRDALRLDPEFALAHVALSEALWRRFHQEGGAELARQAAAAARRARAIDPDLPEARVALARALRATGRAQQSIESIAAVLADHPRPAEALRELGISYRAAGDQEEAESCFRQAVRLEPDDWMGWNALGSFLVGSGELAEAAEAYRRADRLAPPSVSWPRQNLASVLILQSKYAAAAEAFEAIAATTSDPVLFSNMATAHFFLGDVERAGELYRRAVSLDPDNPTLHRNLGDLLLRSGDRQGALAAHLRALVLVEEALEGGYHDPQLVVERAVLAAKLGVCDDATHGLDELWATLPLDAKTAHGFAQAWALCGETEAALDALERAVEAGWSADMLADENEFRHLAGEARFRALVR